MSRRNTALYVVALLLACACVAGAVLVYLERGDRAEAKTEQERYGAVLASARSEADALMNIGYLDPQAAIDEITSGATGEFKEEFEQGSDPLTELLEEGEVTQEGKVVWAGVVAVDSDSARVIVATSGTATSTSNKDEHAVSFRMQLDLELVDGDWLTEKLEFIK